MARHRPYPSCIRMRFVMPHESHTYAIMYANSRSTREVYVSDGELMRMVNGEVRVAREDKPMVQRAKRIRHEVLLGDYKAKGAIAFADSAAGGLIELYDNLEDLAQGKPARAAIVGRIFNRAARQVDHEQANLFNHWGM